ncbi:LPS translocon maturation chaperone LptM [Basilea psittacipulmonis]
MKTLIIKCFVILGMAFIVSSCGYKGDLYLPNHQTSASIQN